ncbi:hypothetical protein [Oleispirillum naphthae]|uniref:hypothetical protein n=1 Tax=Oleispirillum naphthae TaxID=2838853 RepID=UPI00308264EF
MNDAAGDLPRRAACEGKLRAIFAGADSADDLTGPGPAAGDRQNRMGEGNPAKNPTLLRVDTIFRLPDDFNESFFQ